MVTHEYFVIHVYHACSSGDGGDVLETYYIFLGV